MTLIGREERTLGDCQLYTVALLVVITVSKRSIMVNQWSLHSPLSEENNENILMNWNPGQYWKILMLQ